jgi:predicted small lipoprotein YifL
MRPLWVGLLALALFLGACGRYGPPSRPAPPEASQAEEESEEQRAP